MSQQPVTTPLFAQHYRKWQGNRYVYPVISRRSKGLSIGVNLNPDRICNFDCVYCCVDRSGAAPSREHVDLDVLRQELDAMLACVVSGEIWQTAPFDTTPQPLRRLNDVAFSGDGEPTSSPSLPAASDLVAQLLQKYKANARIVLITNATLLDRPSVNAALTFLDHHNGEVWAKLDAGDETLYRQVVRTQIPLQHIVDNILLAGRARPIVVQSMFLQIRGISPTVTQIEHYADRIRELVAAGCKVRLVQVYTIARPVHEAGLDPLPGRQLDAIVARLQKDAIPAEAYYAPPT
jgi:wyosine [tRNA(Phe)-imidazoG37] synthetase (radical SAM superfamily)